MNPLRQDALSIWNAGVDAVRAQPLVEREVRVEGDTLRIGDLQWARDQIDRIVIVGAGKAATAMAAGVVAAIGDWLPIVGWINVPDGTQKNLGSIQVHAARPAGVNEPTIEGVAGTHRILELVREATDRDLCIALMSGGGSALLPAPIEGISLQDKLAVTRRLSGAGADIRELNTVRKHLSAVKGGGLLRACRARELVTLILSDVLGDPLDLIASGPTVIDTSTPQDALAVLQRYDPNCDLPEEIYKVLSKGSPQTGSSETCPSTILVIGNNAVAVDAAGIRAESLGYNHAMQSASDCEGAAEEVGRKLAEITLEMIRSDLASHRTDCLITGGEPTVELAPADRRGRGGRNQHLVLAAYDSLLSKELDSHEWQRLVILSGGTDGEDGPTDAAGAVLDADVHRRATERGLDVADFLARNDAYSFFEQTGGLIITGPTGTNVCDVRVALARAGDEGANL